MAVANTLGHYFMAPMMPVKRFMALALGLRYKTFNGGK